MVENKVSCVIVTYNAATWIGHVLTEVLHSSVKMDILIIDNGSTDGTQQIVRSSPAKVDFIQAKENLGFGKGNNIGIKRAYESGADYVFLLNQDAWPEENAIRHLVETSLQHPEYGVLSPIHLDGTGRALDFNFSRYVSPPFCQGFYSDAFLNTIRDEPYELPFVNAAAWLITRKCIETVGGFSSTFFHYSEDDNYCQRILFHGMKIGLVGKSLIYHDRQNVIKSSYFTNYDKIIKRSLALKYSNPATNYTVAKMLLDSAMLLLKDILVAIVKLDKRRFTIFKSRLRVFFYIKYALINKNRKISQTKGPNFLD